MRVPVVWHNILEFRRADVWMSSIIRQAWPRTCTIMSWCIEQLTKPSVYSGLLAGRDKQSDRWLEFPVPRRDCSAAERWEYQAGIICDWNLSADLSRTDNEVPVILALCDVRKWLAPHEQTVIHQFVRRNIKINVAPNYLSWRHALFYTIIKLIMTTRSSWRHVNVIIIIFKHTVCVIFPGSWAVILYYFFNSNWPSLCIRRIC